MGMDGQYGHLFLFLFTLKRNYYIILKELFTDRKITGGMADEKNWDAYKWWRLSEP